MRTGKGGALGVAVRAGRVYTRSSNGWLSLDSTTCRHIFERDLGVLVTTEPSVIDGQLIVATGDGYVRSYIPDDGELSWRAWLGAQLVSPPVGAGDYLMCVADNGYLYALSARDGQIVWRRRVHGWHRRRRGYGSVGRNCCGLGVWRDDGIRSNVG